MFGALGTALCFALTPVFANRSAHQLGSLAANLARLAVAAVILGIWARFGGRGIGSDAEAWLFLGGVLGFGLGGVSMFLALTRLGANLSTLIVQCGSAVAAAAVEYLWLGTRLSPGQAIFAALTVSGVAVGLLPRSLPPLAPGSLGPGLIWALVSALGQGAGAVFSRKAFAVAAAAHSAVDPGTAAYVRVLGGLGVAILVVIALPAFSRGKSVRNRKVWLWVVGNAVCGPVLGVTFYQWALRMSPAGLVQPIVATAPLLTVPLSRRIEGAPQPRGVYWIGAVAAVAGAAGIALVR